MKIASMDDFNALPVEKRREIVRDVLVQFCVTESVNPLLSYTLDLPNQNGEYKPTEIIEIILGKYMNGEVVEVSELEKKEGNEDAV